MQIQSLLAAWAGAEVMDVTGPSMTRWLFPSLSGTDDVTMVFFKIFTNGSSYPRLDCILIAGLGREIFTTLKHLSEILIATASIHGVSLCKRIYISSTTTSHKTALRV